MQCLVCSFLGSHISYLLTTNILSNAWIGDIYISWTCAQIILAVSQVLIIFQIHFFSLSLIYVNICRNIWYRNIIQDIQYHFSTEIMHTYKCVQDLTYFGNCQLNSLCGCFLYIIVPGLFILGTSYKCPTKYPFYVHIII